MEDGQGLTEALRASGQTVSAFARRHGVHAERVRRLVRREEQRAAPSGAAVSLGFAPVRVVERAEPAEGAALEVTVGVAVIRVGRDFDEALLGRVVAALGGGRC